MFFNLDLQKILYHHFWKTRFWYQKKSNSTLFVPRIKVTSFIKMNLQWICLKMLPVFLKNASMEKAVAKISYNPTYEDFVHDPLTSKTNSKRTRPGEKSGWRIKSIAGKEQDLILWINCGMILFAKSKGKGSTNAGNQNRTGSIESWTGKSQTGILSQNNSRCSSKS